MNRPYFHHALNACNAPSANRIPVKICRISLGLMHFAIFPPAMPPKNTPGISSIPVFHDTNPSFEYAISAKTPVGGISATKEVPCARCWLKAKSSPRSGTKMTPPPMPNIPEAIPHTQAIAKIPASRPIDSATSFLQVAAGRLLILPRFSPEQECRQHQETSECSFQVP